MTTDTADLIAEYAPLVDGIAAEYARKYHKYGVERSDVSQELFLFLVKHPRKIAHWVNEDPESVTKMLARTLRNEASRFGRAMKAQVLGYSPADEVFYAKAEIEILLDAMFDENAWHEPPVSEDGGRGRRDPATGGGWIATLADVANAFQQLPTGDRDLLAAFHRDGELNKDLARRNGISEGAMSNRHDKAITKLHKLLGGSRPRWEHKDDCDCAGDGLHCECRCDQYTGARLVMTNAAARAITANHYEE